ncbi:MAG: tRNA(5-methylaminomethyl-2-thiouridylate) methyltransferase, partial [Bilophila sp.]
MTPSPHAVALFSGGLDSILATRLIQEQGLVVRCLHFVTPFFGKPHLIPHWEEVYGLSIEAVDVSEAYIRLLLERPEHGFGKVLNPCVDCKILMMRTAREIMARLGATFLISGEVLGQRPMSQRRDTLNVIRREGAVRDTLLRPLCAQHLDPTEPELSGLVDRSRLLSIFGRGRK